MRFDVFTGTICESRHDNLQDALASARRNASYRKQRARIIIPDLAPDGDWRVTPAWAGGTWGGRCGSSKWLDNPGFVPEQKYPPTNERVRRSQWPSWIEKTGGFRVECQQRRRHLGPCAHTQGDYVQVFWSQYETIKYAPAQPTLFEV